MEQPQSADNLKREILIQIAELSRLLGMMCVDDVTVQKATEVHLKLSVLVGKALDIQIQ